MFSNTIATVQKINRFKTLSFFLIIILLPLFSIAQFNRQNPTIPSANIGAGKQSLEISGNSFNGRANVNLPIYSYDLDGMPIPINLNYSSANGIKPDELPSWVGSGWNLQVGGYIHRTVRGRADEALDFKTGIYNFKRDVSGFIARSKKRTLLLSADYSYFTNYNKLDVSNWFTQSYANSITQGHVNYEEDFDAQDHTETWTNAHPFYDLVPDEFTFSFGDISGKFYLNHLNKWVVESNNGEEYSIEVFTGEQVVIDATPVNFRFYYKIPRIIKYIIITSNDGIKYTFGNSDLNASFDNQYFEYSHSSVVLALNGDNFPFNPLNSGTVEPTYLDIVPHTWHLTKIQNPKTSSSITFNYKKAMQFYKTRQAWGSPGVMVYQNNQIFTGDIEDPDPNFRLSALSKVLTRSWVLTDINFSNGIKIDFISTISSQLSSNENINQSDYAGFNPYEDISFISYPTNLNTLFKLDKISISFTNNLKKEIDFNYLLSNSQRLQLANVKEKEISGTFNNEYKFGYNTYNQIQLPPYGVGKNDHWGFFNNKDFFSLGTPPFDNYNALLAFSSSKDPDPSGDYSSAEILKRIIYPNGGKAEFTYEPQTYSKKIGAGFLIDNIGVNNVGGGVRVKKISYYSDDNHLSREKVYEYQIPGSNSISSGVLGDPIPTYLTSQSSGYSFRAQGIDPINYGGNNVTYTFVTEKESGNGRTQYEYTNYDNNYNDAPPKEFNFQGSYFNDFSYAFSHYAFKRGRPLVIKSFNESGDLVKENDFHFEHENSENDKDEVRSLYLSAYSFPDKYSSVSERIYQDHLISQEEKTIASNGILSEKNNTSYDIYGNIKQTISYDSKGYQLKQTFKYCYQFSPSSVSDNICQGIYFLNGLSIKSSLIEKITYRELLDGSNSNIINATLYTYKPGSGFLDKVFNLNNSGPIAKSTFIECKVENNSFVRDSRYSSTEEIHIDSYDSKGNILQQTDKNGISTVYFWGYNGLYPVAKVIGANSSIRPWVDQSVLDNPSYSDQQMRDQINNLRAGLISIGSKALVTSYTYKPLIGLSSQTDPNGKTNYYSYDGFGRLILVWDQDKKIIKKICYNNAGQAENCITTPTYNSNAFYGKVYKNNCTGNQIGRTLIIPVPAAQFHSYISQEDADAQVSEYTQQIANVQGQCIDAVYARLEILPAPTANGGWTQYNYGYESYANQIVAVWVKFYSDPNYTQPLTLTKDINFSITERYDMNFLNSSYQNYSTITGTALTGTDGYLIDDIISLYGEWNLYDENQNQTYMEQWSDHFTLEDAGADFRGAKNLYQVPVIPGFIE